MTAMLAPPVESRRSPRPSPWLWAGPAAGAVGTAAVLAWDPFERDVEVCWLHASTGLLCPACGATRAWYLLAHGDLGGALRHNLVFVLAGAWLACLWVLVLVRSRRGTDPEAPWPLLLRPPGQFRARLRVAALGVLLAFAVVRNLPGVDFLGPA